MWQRGQLPHMLIGIHALVIAPRVLHFSAFHFSHLRQIKGNCVFYLRFNVIEIAIYVFLHEARFM